MKTIVKTSPEGDAAITFYIPETIEDLSTISALLTDGDNGGIGDQAAREKAYQKHKQDQYEQELKAFIETEKEANDSTELDVLEETAPMKQYCAICSAPVMYDPHYPRHVCGDCYVKACSKDGRTLSFYNLNGGEVMVQNMTIPVMNT